MRYPATILLGAFLLFQVQPQIARCILPWFGGGPAVWSACLLFFQVLLLGGYAYAHVLHRCLAPRAQAALHAALLAGSLLALPVVPDEAWKPTGAEEPTLRILLLLLATVGLPYLLLAATGPLLQSWFAREHPGRSPYRLYALSNTGSLAALVSFPFVFEPNLTIGTQATAWGLAYCAFFVLTGACALSFARGRAPVERAVAPRPAARAPAPGAAQLRAWVALAALPSVMLLAVTNVICVDIAVIPFLWVMPLAIYLTTFILTFHSATWYRPRALGPALAALAVLLLLCADADWFAGAVALPAVTYSIVLFLCGMVCHGELVRRKPEPAHLTSFYFCVSAGGALGGAFVAVVAPALFSSYLEVEIGLGLCAGVGLLAWARAAADPEAIARLLCRKALPFAVGVAFAAAIVIRGQERPDCLERNRNFFGQVVVQEAERLGGSGDAPGDVQQVRRLRHGSTLHGEQITGAGVEPGMGRTYFGRESGVAYALRHHPAAGDRPLNVGVIGLGTGTLACYAREYDRYTFYEIDPAVIRIAETHFTYLADARDRHALASVRLGDARIQMERDLRQTRRGQLDVLVVDAFSSDSIPVHLLTREANDIYWQKLAPDGILLIHLSNRFLDLLPVAQGLATDARKQLRLVSVRADETNTKVGSRWALVTDSREFLAQPRMRESRVPGADGDTDGVLWTDDYSSLWHVIR